MKTKILKYSLLIAIMGIAVWSCNKEEKPTTITSNNVKSQMSYQDLRQELISGELHFINLTKQEKIDVVLSKLNQILSHELNSNVETLINDLIQEVPKFYNDEANDLASLGVQLADIIPEHDFMDMFYRFEDYVYNGSYYGNEEVSEDIKNEIAGLAYFGGGLASGLGFHGPEPKKLLYCDCNWTCGYLNTNCIQTASGCGFIWASGCTYIDLAN